MHRTMPDWFKASPVGVSILAETTREARDRKSGCPHFLSPRNISVHKAAAAAPNTVC
jgi:hypothetical protein